MNLKESTPSPLLLRIQKHEDPDGCRGPRTSLIPNMLVAYSFKELGSDKFLGVFRLR
jgi:hypothetical protein